MKPIIYVDVLFFFNLLVNGVLLLITASVLSLPISVPKILISASVGGVYAVFLFFPGLRLFYTLLAKIAVSAVMVQIAFSGCKTRIWKKALPVFYGASFALCGILLALLACVPSSFLQGAVFSNGIFYFRLPATLFAWAIGLLCILLGVLKKEWKKRKNRCYLTVKLSLSQKSVCLYALVDTGNMLTDPLCGASVMIASYDAVSKLLPDSFNRLYLKCGETAPERLLLQTDDDVKARLRLIPFSALGTQNGMIIGFRPDVALVNGVIRSDVIVGICRHSLSEGADYNALISPELTDTDSERKRVFA